MSENKVDEYYRSYNDDQTIKQYVQGAGYTKLFRFADKIDIGLMLLGTGLALAGGVSLVFYARPFGQLVDAFANPDPAQIVNATLESVYGFLINSVIVFVIAWFSTAVWMVTSQRQMICARKMYFQSLLRQETAWHDRNKPAQVCSRMYIQIAKVHHALVNNVTSVLTKFSLGVSGIVIALTRGWLMAMVMIGFLPLMMIAAFVSSHYYKKSQRFLQRTKAKTDSDVIEVFENVRTVRMLAGENYQTNRYARQIKEMEENTTSNGVKSKLAFAVFFFSILMNYALGFWFGAKLVSEETYNSNSGTIYLASDVVVIFFTLYLANLSLSGLPQSFASFNVSRISMKKMLLIIDRQSRVVQGSFPVPQKIDQIVFKDVLFRYDKPLFKNFDLKIKKGVTALIGESGNGKTTIINLIMRFYDIFHGQIGLNANGKFHNLVSFTFDSLRSKIGYVGQEPVLIGKTIRQVLNAQKLSEQEIKDVLEKVKAWEFVQKIGIENQFNSLSGGQKQRIAIARALVKKPEILILDEGTSALDRRTEQQVLKNLKKMRIPFIIMIAHRMETVVNADRIIKLSQGKIVAEGTFSTLVRDGVLQEINIAREENQPEIEEEQNVQQVKKVSKQQVFKLIQQMEKGEEEKKQEELVGSDRQFKMKYICKLIKLNKSYWYLYVVGIFGALYIGSIFPVFAFILSRIIVTLSGIQRLPDSQLPALQQQIYYLSLALFMISLSSLVILCLKGVSWVYVTQSLGMYLKRMSFSIAISKPMKEIDQIGKQQLAHLINANCEDLKYLGGHHLSDIFQNIMTILVGLGIAFGYSWAVTLIALGFFPLILLSGKAQMSFNNGMSSQTDKVHKRTHEMVIDTILNHKTVRSLNIEHRIVQQYSKSLDGALYLSIKNGNLAGIMLGLGQSLISIMLALIFYIGALLIQAGSSDVLSVYTAIYAIMFAGVQAGGNMFFLNKLSASTIAACNYFQLIEPEQQDVSQSSIFTSRLAGSVANNAMHSLRDTAIHSLRDNDSYICDGDVKFVDMEFKYPSRDKMLFKNFNLKIKPGEKVALVGQSGSGKSSIANLLFRIYDHCGGKILIDNKEVDKFDLYALRTRLGIVSQQPVLFNRSVFQNIKYNMENVTFAEVVEAAKQANAYNFICQGNFGLKDVNGESNDSQSELTDVNIEAFRKSVGTKGSYLSGGQKQRVAIARALVRRPRIMVLDQATSALDNANQKIVQEAIQKIQGITQIVIAHRLSTVQKCDKIVVMRQGVIIEQGGYKQLLQRKGYFHSLVNAIGDSSTKEQLI